MRLYSVNSAPKRVDDGVEIGIGNLVWISQKGFCRLAVVTLRDKQLVHSGDDPGDCLALWSTVSVFEPADVHATRSGHTSASYRQHRRRRSEGSKDRPSVQHTPKLTTVCLLSTEILRS